MTIRAGDLHRKLGLTGRAPAVCSALGSKIFARLAGVVLIDRVGPRQSTTTQFRYSLEPDADDMVAYPVRAAAEPPDAVKSAGIDVSPHSSAGVVGWDAAGNRRLFLVSRVKTKRSRPGKAKEIYVSDWFRKARALVEREGCAWRILSAKYGLVHPDDVIEPYEKTLVAMRAAERRNWAGTVLEALEPCLAEADRVVFLAGERYRELLEPSLRSRGIVVDVPMRGLSQGRQGLARCALA
ncbi:MAG: hypothetical protein OXH15_01980 [Gammaproteobacteria bacterium]|nr:hypothetical protein [Gammaproteobacteria bacterium]